MKFGWQATNPMEWIALKANLVPLPMTDAQGMMTWAKVILTAFKLDIFEAVKDSPQTIVQIAQRTGLSPNGLEGLMKVLISAGYIGYKDGKFGLTKSARKWCRKDSPDSIYNYNRWIECCWDDVANHVEEYVKTGKGLEIHDTYTEEQWHWYQLAMEENARTTIKYMARKTPMPRHPAEMLDIGGSHGLCSVELCRKYPTLKSTILDLPQAVEKAQPILVKYNMGNRINYWAGNALTDDFGENRYDLILISNLMHHFNAEQNTTVSQKAVKALKPGGYFVIQEFLRPETSSHMSPVGAFLDFAFNLVSTANSWNVNELKDFQQKAGLTHYKVINIMKMIGLIQVCAWKE